MNADIFISYSSKDREQALQLIELLSSAGLSVWIDQSGIDIATSWSKEIVQAINGCTAFVVLLSPNSILSENVVKEVSLAAERKKKILPLDLEPVSLPDDLAYHLAGIQRAPMTNIDAIIRAIGKLGLEATKPPEMKLVKETDGRKSLMILPFDDLSPTADNEWFANGIAAELISSLSNVKALRVIDQQTTKEFKNYKGHLTVYAKEMSIRYFIQGSVRKFGDQIKISSVLLDIETGDHLWQDSLKGTMDDIFDIQEQVAEKVVEGLKVIVTGEEKQKLSDRGTENIEAYELYLKGNEYLARVTKSDYERALSLYERSVSLDPNFVKAHSLIVLTLEEIYRLYSRNSTLLDRANVSAERIRGLEGETAMYLWTKSHISRFRNDFESAVVFAKRSLEVDPDFALGYSALGFAYQGVGDLEGAVRARKEYVRLRENDINAKFNLLTAISERNSITENLEELRNEAERAIPYYQRHLRLAPDDFNARANYAAILLMAGRTEESRLEVEELSDVESLDGFAYYNLACISMRSSNSARALELLRRSIAKGFIAIDAFRRDPDLATLRGTPEFEALIKELEEKIAEEKNG